MSQTIKVASKWINDGADRNKTGSTIIGRQGGG